MKNLINKIGMDKIAHFGVGSLICAFFTFVFLIQDIDFLALEPWRIILLPTIGSIVTLFLSVIKELIIDEVRDWKDLAAAMIGCGTIYIATAIGVLFNILS